MKLTTIILFLIATILLSIQPARPAGAETREEYLESIGVCLNKVDEFGQYPTCGYPFCRPKREDGVYTNTEGDLRIQYIYKDDKIDGLFRIYRIDTENKDKLDNRVFLEKYRYVDGKLEGPQRVYDADKGYLRRQCEYKDGKIKNSIDYAENEQETMRRGYTYDDTDLPKLSRYQKYAEDGAVTEELKDGIVKYFVNGNVEKEETYEAKVEREYQEKLEADLEKRKRENPDMFEYKEDVYDDLETDTTMNAETNAEDGWKETPNQPQEQL